MSRKGFEEDNFDETASHQKQACLLLKELVEKKSMKSTSKETGLSRP